MERKGERIRRGVGREWNIIRDEEEWTTKGGR